MRFSVAVAVAFVLLAGCSTTGKSGGNFVHLMKSSDGQESKMDGKLLSGPDSHTKCHGVLNRDQFYSNNITLKCDDGQTGTALVGTANNGKLVITMKLSSGTVVRFNAKQMLASPNR